MNGLIYLQQKNVLFQIVQPYIANRVEIQTLHGFDLLWRIAQWPFEKYLTEYRVGDTFFLRFVFKRN